MTQLRHGARYASWLKDDMAGSIASPASLGVGADLVGFGGGQPAVELYPLNALERAFGRALQEDAAQCLPYSATQGLPLLRQVIAERLALRKLNVDPEHIVVMAGSMQGLHVIGRVFLNHGDTIVTEAPTFMGALSTWEHQEPRYMAIPVDADGMDVDALEERLRTSDERPKFVYLLPTFQNPSGTSLSLPRRHQLLEIADRYDLIIIEDDPYGAFWYDEAARGVPPVRSLPGAERHVIYLSTFSKIIAPGIRLAFTAANPDLTHALIRAKAGVDFHTGGLVQQAIARLIHDGDFDLDAHIDNARHAYRGRRDAMLDALETHFPPSSKVEWTRPAGGFFMWIEMPEGLAARDVATLGLEEGVAVFPGPMFYPSGGGSRALRLSFSNTSPERIAEGIRRLSRAIDRVRAPTAT